MADETQPLIEQERTYDPTDDPVVQGDHAYDIYKQYVTDVSDEYGHTTRRTNADSSCEVAVVLHPGVEPHTLPKILKMDKIELTGIETPNPDGSGSFVVRFEIEDGFRVPVDYQPDGPDEAYLKSLFGPTARTQVETDQTVTVFTESHPEKEAFKCLEIEDEFHLNTVDYRGDGDYAINIRWLGNNTES